MLLVQGRIREQVTYVMQNSIAVFWGYYEGGPSPVRERAGFVYGTLFA